MTNETASPTCTEYAQYLNTTGCAVFPVRVIVDGLCCSCGKPLEFPIYTERDRAWHAGCRAPEAA